MILDLLVDGSFQFAHMALFLQLGNDSVNAVIHDNGLQQRLLDSGIERKVLGKLIGQ